MKRSVNKNLVQAVTYFPERIEQEFYDNTERTVKPKVCINILDGSGGGDFVITKDFGSDGEALAYYNDCITKLELTEV